MGHLGFVRVFALALGVLAFGEPQQPQFRTGTDTIPIYVTVLDASGRLVTDLTRDDFEVRDNDKPQALTMFTNGEQPITVAMMLDRSGSVEPQFTLVENAAAEFVAHLGAADRARIGSFSLKVQIDPAQFTSDHDALVSILRHGLQPFGPTPLWNATDAAMTAVAAESGRRVVLMFTDGKDLPIGGPNVSYEDVRLRAETEDVMIYGIGLVNECAPASALALRTDVRPRAASSLFAQSFQRRGGGLGRRGFGQGRGRSGGIPPPGRILPLPPRPPAIPGGGAPPPKKPSASEPVESKDSESGCSASRPDPHLRKLTEIGGGGYFELHSTDDLPATFARVADELHRQYLVAFVAQQRDGALHQLEVRVRRPDLIVRARRGYVAPR
jgi:VWFA-related protein